MRVIKPIAITDAKFVSCTTPETDFTDWTIGATFALNAKCQYKHRVYQSLQAANTGNTPGATNSAWWVDAGPTNRWAQFDNEINTQTLGVGTLTTVIKPGAINALSLFGLKGKSVVVTIRKGLDGPVVYSRTRRLDGTIITNLYEYRYEPKVDLTEITLLNLPVYSNAHITVSVIGKDAGSDVACGAFICGTTYYIGDAKYGATAGIIDYSTIETDEFGTTSLVKRNFAKRANVSVLLPKGRFFKVHKILSDLRATPCVWVAVETAGYEPLSVFGIYSQFLITVEYETELLCDLEYKGMI